MTQIRQIVDDVRFQRFIITVILINAVVLGLLTLDLPPALRATLTAIDNVCLVIFCIELAMKIAAYGTQFFRQGWNIFDLIVVGIALLPNTGSLSVLRALRVLRVVRLVTAIPAMRRVINGMFAALPGGASVAGILFILYYVAAIIGVTLFSATVPKYFGDLGTTFFTLFQLMTLEGWNGVAEEVMAQHPRAWVFFVCFIVFTNFTTLNLLFGIIVDAMEKAKEEEVREVMADKGVTVEEVPEGVRLAQIEEEVRQVRAMLARIEAAQARV
jgi:voltage-gated sodium channel